MLRIVLLLLLVVLPSRGFAQRLPGGVVPEHYEIALEPDLANATFAGAETISVRVERPTATLVLNAAEIEFDAVAVTAMGQMQNAKVIEDAAKEQVTFRLPRAIPAGTATITIKFRGILNDQLRGLYLSKTDKRRYAVTQLEATDARRMFPSFDEPAYKATFALTVVLDEGDRAISNGAVVSDTPGPRPGKHTVKFDTSPKMSTYLVALAVGDFECISGAADGTPIRICSTPDKKGLTGFALESAQHILQYLNRYYDVNYPFKKLDVVAVPDFAAGAMENVGAIFYREEYLLADPRAASTKVKKDVAVVLAHEIAHQWFGNLVTMQWWDDLWLNEGFASWMETKPIAEWKPEWQVEIDEVKANQDAMALDGLRSTRAIRSTASTPAEINELFDAITYQKGAAVVRMIEEWVGDEAFRAGVNAYLEKFKYGNARAEDFWTTVASASGKPVDRVMKSFIDQPGVPLVAVEIECAGSAGKAVLSQQRYVRDEAARSSSALWSIPVCVRTPEGKTSCSVVSQKSSFLSFDSCPAWVMPNAGALGYYRVGYPAGMLRALASDVASLAPNERIAVLSDEWASVRAGRHDIGSFMDLASGFRGERSGAVLGVLTETLAVIEDELTTDATSGAYREWMSSLLSPALDEVGWTPRPNESPDAAAARSALVKALGRTARDPKVLATARDLAVASLTGRGSIDAEILNGAVDLAAIGGDAALFDQYLAHARAASDPEEKYRYLNALTSFTDPALTRRTMDVILGADVRGQDVKPMIAAMLGNPDTQRLAWELVRARWRQIQTKTGESVGNTIVVGALSAFCDAKTAAEVKQFFSTHAVPDAERTLQQSRERIGSCAASARAQAPRLAAWLKATQRPATR